jgi:ATP-dependent helicase HrpA
MAHTMSDPLADLRARVEALPTAERTRYRKRLAGAGRVVSPDRRKTILAAIAADLDGGDARLASRAATVPIGIRYPDELPITARRRELLDTIEANQVVIVAGETGSGKSTQLPKMCLELGRGIRGLIGHTQPRRIAARSIAQRVAEELETTVGATVGFSVRFSDQVSDDTLVKVMTDGILLAEIQRDPELTRYDTIIVDEAHERSLNVDFLLGYLHRLLPRRPDLKVIVTSATIDTERFSRHFWNAPIIEVSGRSHPVEIRYRPFDDADEPDTQAEAIAAAVRELSAEGPGDVLVFCAGEREIREASEAVESLGLRDTEIVPLYARLSAAEQGRIFQPHRGRRVVVSTNVAETSLTVPGIRSVVDAGTARISRYGRRTKVQRLPIEPVSKASADQRAGRCGRLGPGICIRLYSQDDYESRPRFTEPEVQRTNLASVILRMAALGLGDVESFPFLDPPDRRSVRDGVALLHELGAVDPRHEGTDRWLTDTGRRLARMPVDPRLARMVLEADDRGCLREVTVIAAALSIQDPRERPADHEQAARQAHARFAGAGSDFMAWLALWDHVQRERKARTSNQFRRMCEDEFLSHRRIREWFDVHGQLRDVAGEVGLVENTRPAEPEAIHRSLLAGLLSHVGLEDPNGHEYRGARGTRFWIQPGSALFKASPRWVMAAELVETTRVWARAVAAVTPEWVEEAADHLVTRSHSDPWWDRARGMAVARETVTLYGLPLATDRVVPFRKVDVAGARESFIRHALVEGDWETEHRFARVNAERIGQVREMEARERRSDMLVDEDTIVSIFDRRLPADITSGRHFDAWRRRSGAAVDLELTLADLIDPDAGEIDEGSFPTEWHYGDITMPLAYEFDPSSPTDGVTIDVPLRGLDRLNPSLLEWNVPGLRPELVTALVRSLPKAIRRELVPIPDTVRRLLPRLDESRGLLESVRAGLSGLTGVEVMPDDFDLDRVPAHLLPSFRVVGDDGSVLAEGTDLDALRSSLRDEARSAVRADGHHLARSGLTGWTIGDLPRSLTIPGPSGPVTVFPSLVDEGETVSVRLLASEAEQGREMWRGTRRLILSNLPPPGRALKPLLDGDARLVLRSGPYDTPAEWMADCAGAACDSVLETAGGPAWDAGGFDDLVAKCRPRIGSELLRAGEGSLEVLGTLRHVLLALEDAPTRFEEAIADIAEQIHLLVYPGFVTGVGTTRLADIDRYLRAIRQRLDRLTADPARDRDLMARTRALEAEHDRLLDAFPSSTELLEVGWSLQELRVSLFAQSLGTRFPVSEKRIRRALERALEEH